MVWFWSTPPPPHITLPLSKYREEGVYIEGRERGYEGTDTKKCVFVLCCLQFALLLQHVSIQAVYYTSGIMRHEGRYRWRATGSVG